MSEREPDAWIERVRAADAEAEAAWQEANSDDLTPDYERTAALLAIAAELRAQRIARRPGGGVT